MRNWRNICKSITNLMQRVSECELMVFCGGRRPPSAGGGPVLGRRPARRAGRRQKPPSIQKVSDCKWYKSKAWGDNPMKNSAVFLVFMCA